MVNPFDKAPSFEVLIGLVKSILEGTSSKELHFLTQDFPKLRIWIFGD